MSLSLITASNGRREGLVVWWVLLPFDFAVAAALGLSQASALTIYWSVRYGASHKLSKLCPALT